LVNFYQIILDQGGILSLYRSVIGQVEKIAANRRIVHNPIKQQRYGSGKCHGLRVGRYKN
jgi:hypothetical protein